VDLIKALQSLPGIGEAMQEKPKGE
jgi:hypothetical protein